MRRFHVLAGRCALAGLTAISLGTAMVVVGFVSGTGAPAYADTAPYELYCPGTPVGNIVLNDVVTGGTISPASPAVGEQFNLTNFQSTVVLPNSIASAAAALGNSAITGSAGIKVDATGATPATVTPPAIPIDTPIPSPVPAAGLTLTLPATPETVGPFTASGGAITLTVDPSIALTVNVSGSALNLVCATYPNNSAPSGITSSAPSVPKASPVIASATTTGTTSTTGGSSTTTASTTSTTTPAAQLTGAYELYCPGTPVGNIALNDAQTVASITPASPDSGSTFNVTGYQTTVILPAALASAAGAVSPGQPLQGSATGQLDVTGATPGTLTTGTENFSVNIPTPVPASGLPLQVPSSPSSVGPFTATNSSITVEQDAATSLTLIVAGSPLTLTCMAFPNNEVTPSGITTSPEPTNSLAPIIAVAASTSPTTTPTSTPTSTSTTQPSTTTTIASTTTQPPTTSTTGGATTTTLTGPTSTTSAPSQVLPVGPGPQTTYTVEPQPTAGTCHYTFEGPFPLPDPSCTPGAISPAVTQANIQSTICVSGYTDTVRPPTSITDKEKQGSAAAYGFAGSFSTAEYDHLVPLEIGGDPNDARNLWVEPNDNPNATSFNNTKDKLEGKLHDLVCSNQLSLASAQQAIASNWITAYQTYVGPLAGVGTSTSTTGAATKRPTTASSVVTSSRSLAFTGPSSGLRFMGIAGMALIVFGLALLALVDAPRRALARVMPALRAARHLPDVSGATRRGGAQVWRRAKDRAQWLLGR